MTVGAHFLHNSLSKSLKYDPWLLGDIYFTIPYQNHEIWAMTARSNFRYNSLPKLSKYDLWLLGAISFTIPYQKHLNMIYDWYGQFPLQFLIKIIEIWHMNAKGNFLIKIIEIWPMTTRAISFTISYQKHRNMTYEC